MASIGDIKINMHVNGYTCGFCGGWVNSGALHTCPNMYVLPTGGTASAMSQCYRCGRWGFGYSHDCKPPIACNHCRCIDVPPSGERTKLHKKCCVCGSIYIAE